MLATCGSSRVHGAHTSAGWRWPAPTRQHRAAWAALEVGARLLRRRQQLTDGHVRRVALPRGEQTGVRRIGERAEEREVLLGGQLAAAVEQRTAPTLDRGGCGDVEIDEAPLIGRRRRARRHRARAP